MKYFSFRFFSFGIAFLIIQSSVLLNAQSMPSKVDQEFLEGLPPSLRSEMESANSMEQDDELEKLFRANTTVESNKMILQNIKEQLEIIEGREAETLDGSGSLDRFGEDFFDTMQTSFMPVNVGNLGSNYILDVGDSFKLILTGSLNEEYELRIARDGSIAIPQIGKVSVAGKSLQEVEALVSTFIQSSTVGVNSFLTLDKIRDVQVLLVGGVKNPGIYTLSGGSNILGAIDIAGGISTSGSFRQIELKRNGEIIYSLDLYDVLVAGDLKTNLTLRSGDAIFVKQINFEVPVSGGVNIPAIFEVIPGETAADLIRYAGNFSQDFSGFGSIHARRIDLKSSNILNIPMNKLDTFTLQPRDNLIVPSYKNNFELLKKVKVEGMVERPGEYLFEEGDTISKIIEKAGGYLPGAYLYGAGLYRVDTLKQEQKYAQLNYSDTINHIISSIGKPNTNINPAVLEFLSEELRSNQFTGRVILDFDNTSSSIMKSSDITLQDGDRLIIPALQRVVHLFGEFNNPISISYDTSLSIKGYIDLAGGLRDSANTSLLVIAPDGRTSSYKISPFSFSNHVEVYPGSIIYAQRKVGDLSGVMYAATISPIVSSLAISLASLNSIQN
jgi:polysaccharide biosynthesis/export protein